MSRRGAAAAATASDVANGGKPVTFASESTQTFQIEFQYEVVKAVMDRYFVLQASVSDNYVPAITSPPFRVVRTKLVIGSALPDKWYKDEGGKEKSMDVQVTLQDAHGRPVTDKAYQIVPTLVYEDGSEVSKKSLLKILQESKLQIDRSGKAIVRFRVDDVSKNHQNQRFRLKVSANFPSDPSVAKEVGFDVSSAVTVRSKRNKRPSMKEEYDHTPVTYTTAPRMSSRFAHQNEMALIQAAAVAADLAPRDIVRRNPPPTELAPSAVYPAVSLDVLASTGYAPAGSPQEAMNHVVEWSNTTVIELMRLSWPVVGYEVDHDGTPNPALPIRRCPSCRVYADTTGSSSDWQHRHDCTLTAILRRYSEGILSNMHMLVQQIHGKSAYEQASRGARSSRPELAPNPSHDMTLRRGSSGGPPMAPVTRQGSVEDLIAIMGPPPDSHFLSDDQVLGGGGQEFVPRSSKRSKVDGGAGSGEDPSRLLAAGPSSAIPAPPPGLSTRGFSEMFPDFTRLESLNFPGFGIDDMSSSMESLVHYIVSEPYNPIPSVVKFPAFDNARQLVGTYQLMESESGPQAAGNGTSTSCSFCPTMSDNVPVDVVSRLQDRLSKLLEEGSSAVKCVADHLQNVQRTTEAVVLEYWKRGKDVVDSSASVAAL